jgi:hypothetical protein
MKIKIRPLFRFVNVHLLYHFLGPTAVYGIQVQLQVVWAVSGQKRAEETM